MVDTNHFVQSNGQNILIYAEIVHNGGHLEMDAILSHFQSFLILTPYCNQFVMPKKNPEMKFHAFGRKSSLSLQKLCKMAAILKWTPFWATSGHFSFWHHVAINLSCQKTPRYEVSWFWQKNYHPSLKITFMRFGTWLYRDRQKPANGTQCPTLTTDS